MGRKREIGRKRETGRGTQIATQIATQTEREASIQLNEIYFLYYETFY